MIELRQANSVCKTQIGVCLLRLILPGPLNNWHAFDLSFNLLPNPHIVTKGMKISMLFPSRSRTHIDNTDAETTQTCCQILILLIYDIYSSIVLLVATYLT